MSYNILFEKYCTKQLYGYCPAWALRWDYRKAEILKEIIQYRADIVSLQVSSVYSFVQCKYSNKLEFWEIIKK